MTPGSDDYRSQQWLDCARGELALARREARTAAGEFDKCTGGQVDELGPYCTYRKVAALRAANDGAAADAASAKLLSKRFPSSTYFYAWVKLGGLTPGRS